MLPVTAKMSPELISTPCAWLASTLSVSVNVLLAPTVGPGLFHADQLQSQLPLLHMTLSQVSVSLKKEVKQTNRVF